MAAYQITCATKTSPCHIEWVETSYGRVWNVKQVRKALKKDRFYTSDGDGHTADVEKTRCVICNKKTIRTDPNNETDNLLDNLPPCA
jgi:hypothetical protein